MPTRHELTPVVAAAQGLVAPDVVASIPFRRVAMGSLSYELVEPELLKFKRAYERTLWAAGVPLYASRLQCRRVRYAHFPVDELDRHARKVVDELGRLVALQVDVSVQRMAGSPGWWELCARDLSKSRAHV